MDVVVSIPKETGELINGLVAFIAAVKVAKADGWDISDFPDILMAAIDHLPDAIEGFEQLDDEIKNDPATIISAVGILAADLYRVLT